MMKRVLLMQFKHESNAFCPVPADFHAFQNRYFDVGERMFPSQRGLGTELGAFLDVLENRPDIQLIPSVSLEANPCGPVTAEVYEFVMQEMETAIRANSPLDGILIVLHGAMQADGHTDGEGDLLERIRELAGWEIPVIASMDLHANVTEKMARCATALVSYECYPHTDTYETGYLAAELMAETLDGNLKPTMACRRLPYLLPLFPTDTPEMQKYLQMAKAYESRPGVRCVRFTHGFFSADVPEMGMGVQAVTNNDPMLAERIAQEMAACIWADRKLLTRTYPTLDEALDRALEPGDGPVVLADASDNPGGGGLGNSTFILRRILERGITGAAVATIVDPASAEACEKAGVGATVRLQLGGWSDPTYSGGPLDVEAYVQSLSDGCYIRKGKMTHGLRVKMGKTAVVEIAGNLVIICSVAQQSLDLEVYRRHGIAPEEQRILVTKSAVHYRASFGPIARDMFTLCLPGYSVPDPSGFTYNIWKHPENFKIEEER